MADDIDRLILQMSADLRRMEKSMDKGRQKANRTARSIESRFDRMNRSLSRSGQRLGQVMSRAFGPILAAATVAGLARVTTGALAAAEAIQDMAGRANVSAEFLQELRYVTSQNGAEVRDFDDAISRLNRRLGLFLQDGAGPAANAFRRLGLDSRIANGELRNSEDVFDAAVRAMQGIENQAERSAIASQLFGEDSGPRLVQLMSLGTDAMNEQRQAARDLGIVMSNDLVDEAARASDTLERMNMQFSTSVNSAIASQADELVALADSLARVAEWAVNAAGAMGDFFSRFAAEGEGLALPATEEGLQARIAQLNRLRAELELGGRLDPEDFTATTLNSPFAQPGQVNLARLEESRARDIGRLVGPSRRDELIRAAEASGQSLAEVFAQELAGLAAAAEERLSQLGTPSLPSVGGGSAGGTGLDRETAADAAARQLENQRAREAVDNEAWLRRHNERIALQRIEIENEIELARLRGDDEEVRRLERELELQERINALVGSGVAYRDAQASAGAYLDAAELARQQGEYREFFRSAFRDGMLAALDGNAGEALSAWWRSYVSRALSGVLDRLADTVFDAISNAGSGGTGGLLSRVGNWFGGFFAQGGTMTPGQYGYAGEAGMERIDALPGGGVKITPVGGVGRASGASAPQALRILLEVQEGDMFASRVASISADAVGKSMPVTVDLARQAASADLSAYRRDKL